MALSTSEHELLVTTCDNMNAAAETCRQVLDMLRSLGASGVVDIAEHNNATSVHANAQNLMHIDSGAAYLGDKVQGDYLFKIYPRGYNNKAYSINRTSFLEGTSLSENTFAFSDLAKLAITDSGNNLLEFADVQGDVVSGKALLKADAVQAAFSDATISFGLHYILGDSTGVVGNKSSYISMYLSAGSNGLSVRDIDFEFGRIIPHVTNTVDLGSSGRVFKNMYLTNAPIVSSDSRRKTDIIALNDNAANFILGLRPVSYKLKTNDSEILAVDEMGEPTDVRDTPGVRHHWGFIAQEVKQAMTSAGIEDAAVWSLADKDDPDSMQSLRYEELIAPMIKTIQVLAAKVEALEAR